MPATIARLPAVKNRKVGRVGALLQEKYRDR